VSTSAADQLSVFANPRATALVVSALELADCVADFDPSTCGTGGSPSTAIAMDERTRDARCPHLGADLSPSTSQKPACAARSWVVFRRGRACENAPTSPTPPTRRVRVYPCDERWGLVWVFNGPSPAFPLPSPPADRRWWSLALPPQRVRCHPHLVLANGLDVTHYETLHDMTFTQPPDLEVGAHEVSVTMRGRPRSPFWRFVAGAHRGDVVARFSTIGGEACGRQCCRRCDFTCCSAAGQIGRAAA
jgi:phenylpropionate dioxygenase-like ring-hydroxylating dioxygenase large terminal subunit